MHTRLTVEGVGTQAPTEGGEWPVGSPTSHMQGPKTQTDTHMSNITNKIIAVMKN